VAVVRKRLPLIGEVSVPNFATEFFSYESVHPTVTSLRNKIISSGECFVTSSVCFHQTIRRDVIIPDSMSHLT
jgi:hypothetical protein